MTGARAAGIAGALALHAALLFGVRFDGRAAAPAPEETIVEVALLGPRQDRAPEPALAPPVPARVAEPEPVRPPRPPKRSKPAAQAPPPAEPEAPPPLPSPVAPVPGGDAARAESPRASVPPSARGLVTARPRYKRSPEPPYPLEARRRRQQGTVLLSVRVSAAGRPESVAIARSSGFAPLDAAAARAVESWEFEPGRLDGEPVETRVEIPIRFELE